MRCLSIVRALAAAALLALGAATPALAQRTVMLDVCNDTGFSVATAAAYRTGPGENRTMRTWFLIEPGACLEGGLNGVTGDDIDLHVMSGVWTWPSGAGDRTWCVSPDGSISMASGEPCSDRQAARGFHTTPIEITGQPGPGGLNVGRVSWRIRCRDLGAADAALCPGAPVDAQGMARPVRTLEICSTGRTDRPIVILEALASGDFAIDGQHVLPGGTCGDLYRGFPETDEVMVAEIGVVTVSQDGQLCLPIPADSDWPASRHCAEGEAIAGYRIHAFAPNVSRSTIYVSQ